MQEARFKVWLERGRSAGTVNSRISNCKRVERYEGDLDARYDADGLAGLRARGESPAAFARRCIPPGQRSSSVTYAQYAPSSRLATRAPRHARCYARFHHGLLTDRLNPSDPKHKIPIKGNSYNGTATLKSAVNLYRDFRNAGCGTAGSTGAPAKRWPQERQTRRPGAHWPVWPQPNDEDLLTLARAMAPERASVAAVGVGADGGCETTTARPEPSL